MSKVKQFHLREGTLVEGKSLGCLNVYLASDYDQLKADSEVVADLVESRLAENLRLKVENERLAAMLNQAVSEGILLSDQRDTLRKQLDEARELLKEPEGDTSPEWADEWRNKRDDWLEANKV